MFAVDVVRVAVESETLCDRVFALYIDSRDLLWYFLVFEFVDDLSYKLLVLSLYIFYLFLLHHHQL